MASRKGGYRPYVDVDTLEGQPKVSNKECAGLVNFYTRAGHSSGWVQGERVRGNLTIRKGTAIATFVNGKYPGNEHGNHAALYIRQDADGIYMMDQWANNEKKPTISSRYVRFKNVPQNADGTWVSASDNGDAFSIIEL